MLEGGGGESAGMTFIKNQYMCLNDEKPKLTGVNLHGYGKGMSANTCIYICITCIMKAR